MGLRDPLSGLDVNERPWNGSADARAFAQQPGPGNPNVGPNGSAQAQALRGAAPAAAEAPVAESLVRPTLKAGLEGQSLLGKAAYGTGRLAATAFPLIKGGGISYLGAETVNHFGDYKLDDPGVDSSAKGTFQALRNGDWGGAGNSLMKGLVETGMDLGSAGANALDYVVPGKAPVSTAYDKMLRGTFGDRLVPGAGTPGTPTATKPSVASGPDLRLGAEQDPRSLTYTGSDPVPRYDSIGQAARLASDPYGMTNTERATASPAGRITVRNGNEFSGSNIKGPVSYVDASGKGLPGTSLRGGGGTVSDVSDPNVTSAMRMAMDQRAHDSAMENLRLRAQLMDAAAGAPPPGVRMGTGETLMSAAREKFAREVGKDSILRDRDISPVDLMHNQTQNRQIDVTERGQDLNNRATLRGQDMTYGATTRGQDITAQGQKLGYGSSMYGHDVSAANAQLANKTARSRLQWEDGWKEREFANKNAQQAFDNKNKTQDETNKYLDDVFRTTDEKGQSVVDGRRKGEFASMLNQHLGEMAKRGRAIGTREAIAEADKIDRDGINALGKDQLQRLLQNFQVYETVRDSHGVGYGSSTHVPSGLEGYEITELKDGRFKLRNKSTGHQEKIMFGPKGSVLMPNALQTPQQRLATAYGN